MDQLFEKHNQGNIEYSPFSTRIQKQTLKMVKSEAKKRGHTITKIIQVALETYLEKCKQN